GKMWRQITPSICARIAHSRLVAVSRTLTVPSANDQATVDPRADVPVGCPEKCSRWKELAPGVNTTPFPWRSTAATSPVSDHDKLTGLVPGSKAILCHAPPR